jgi:hypothetical protein
MVQVMKNTDITIRSNDGKCHPAIDDGLGWIVICRCPGSQNGTLAAKAVKVADGHAKSNCQKRKVK